MSLILKKYLPIMQIKIHFLKTLSFLCKDPKIITPIIPLIIGLPPTAATARGNESPEKKGSIKYDRTIEIALKIPK